MQRCGGACPSTSQSCVPTKQRQRNVSIIVGRYYHIVIIIIIIIIIITIINIIITILIVIIKMHLINFLKAGDNWKIVKIRDLSETAFPTLSNLSTLQVRSRNIEKYPKRLDTDPANLKSYPQAWWSYVTSIITLLI